MEIRRAAKTGRGPALFDLLPNGGGDGVQTPVVSSPVPTSRGGDGLTRAPGDLECHAPAMTAVAGDGAVRSREPLIEFDGDRIRVSLTSVTSAAVLFVLLGVLAGAFGLGHAAGWKKGERRGFQEGQAAYSTQAISDIEAARRRPPETNVIRGLLDSPPGGAASSTESASPAAGEAGPRIGSKWVRDHTYIVVQEFVSGRRADAVTAQAFLTREGIATEVVEFAGGSVRLITAQGFNRTDPTQRQLADQLLKRVHEVGQAFWSSGGGYKLDGYFKTLKSDSW